MAFDERLAFRIRESLAGMRSIEEKKMMGGLVFMYKEKMCVGIFRNELMCRVDPELIPKLLTKTGTSQMEFGGRVMKGYLLVSEAGLKTKKQFDHWIQLCLDFNKKAKSSKQK